MFFTDFDLEKAAQFANEIEPVLKV